MAVTAAEPQTSSVSFEKPLTGAAKLGLAGAATGIILLFYGFVLVSVIVMLALLAIEALVLLALARFGLAGPMAKVMNEHAAPVEVFFRSLWLRKGIELSIPLKPEEAPNLFRCLGSLCERVRVNVPQTVLVEMTVGAWVVLKGYRRGAGKTTLGIGYDLLAGLTESEVQAVLAHEISHARLVQRGFKRWLGGGLNRAIQLASGLAAQSERARQNRQSIELSEWFLARADWFARTCARLVAACSRQDEFAADQGAAVLCGTAPLRSALCKLEAIDRRAARLPLNERMAQLQLGAGFSDWLLKELAAESAKPATDNGDRYHNQYSTHPTLRDRLAALPEDGIGTAGPSGAAIKLLARPDEVAQRLIQQIQRVLAAEEEKDTRALERWRRKTRGRGHLRSMQVTGVFLVLVTVVVFLSVWFVNGLSWILALVAGLTCTMGILGYKFGGYRDRIPLPVPDFAQLKAQWQTKPGYDEAAVKQMEATLRSGFPGKRKRQNARYLADQSYEALKACDYVRAHCAASLCLDLDQNNVEGTLALAVSAAALRQDQQVTWALGALQRSTRLLGASPAWGAGWALFLSEDWVHAEALLREARRGRESHPTLLAVLACCQRQRGKLQSAILSARKACSPTPPNHEYTKLIINLLLDGGFLLEATERLNALKPLWQSDPELIMAAVRLSLLRNVEPDLDWIELLRNSPNKAQLLVELGGRYETARKPEKAVEFYTEARDAGYYPEALLGLGRIAAEQQNKNLAELHLLAALNTVRPPADGSVGPFQTLHPVLGQLMLLQDPVPNCRAWIVTLSAHQPAAAANQSFMIFAPTETEADRYLREMLKAMDPDAPPPAPGTINWRQAPRQQQPDGPVHPGVQGLVVN